ncbi:hypothetical protein MferCBS31731_004157 [Microsporum ferrugineum]
MGVYLGDHILYLVPRNEDAEEAVYLMSNINRAINIRGPGGLEEGVLSLILSFAVPPKDTRIGFLFGREIETNDVILDGYGVSKHHFSISFNDSTGILLVYCISSRGLTVGEEELQMGDYQVIEDNAIIHCGKLVFQAVFPDRGPSQAHYAKRLGHYLGSSTKRRNVTVTGAYANPVQPHQHIGQYLELETRNNGTFVDTSLFTDDQTGGIFDVRKYRNGQDILKMKEQISTLKHLRHENIVQYVDCITDQQGNLCVVTEHMPEGDLSTFKPSMLSDVVEILRQCLNGLGCIHAHDLVHGDIRPDNIALRSVFPIDAKICGFGLAADGPIKNVKIGAKYWAPEVLLRYETPGAAVDIWALGAILLLLCDVFPHREAEALTRSRKRNRDVNYLLAIEYACDRLPPSLAQFARGMLSPFPNERWTADECLEELGRVQVDVSVLPPVSA